MKSKKLLVIMIGAMMLDSTVHAEISWKNTLCKIFGGADKVFGGVKVVGGLGLVIVEGFVITSDTRAFIGLIKNKATEGHKGEFAATCASNLSLAVLGACFLYDGVSALIRNKDEDDAMKRDVISLKEAVAKFEHELQQEQEGQECCSERSPE